jgi:hypothetical protein
LQSEGFALQSARAFASPSLICVTAMSSVIGLLGLICCVQQPVMAVTAIHATSDFISGLRQRREGAFGADANDRWGGTHYSIRSTAKSATEVVVKNGSKDIDARNIHPLIKPIGNKYEVLFRIVL